MQLTLVTSNVYNMNISWDQPSHNPDNYTVLILDAKNKQEFNLSGVSTKLPAPQAVCISKKNYDSYTCCFTGSKLFVRCRHPVDWPNNGNGFCQLVWWFIGRCCLWNIHSDNQRSYQ